MSQSRIQYTRGDGSSVSILPADGESVLAALRRLDPGLVEAPCGGAGTCGKCRVRLVSGDLPPPDAAELRLLGAASQADQLRLACRLHAEGELHLAEAAVSTGAVIRESFSLPPRSGGADDPEGRRSEAGTFGAAVDIGTTTIAVYLVEYAPSGGKGPRIVGSSSCLNRQRAFGADVIARIDHCVRNPGGLAELASLVREDIRTLVDRLLSASGAAPSSLRDISVVGNTTMLHLFARTDPSSIAVAPFTPVFTDTLRGPASDFGLPYQEAEVLVAPSVAGYVGADLVAAGRAVDLEHAEGLTLLIDLGTNGEMALGDRRGVIACATAAGPAFEGAAISCGLGGVAGAIDRVRLNPEGGVSCTTIGGGAAIGICGSGIIDAAACLVRSGAVDETGALDEVWSEGGYPLVGDLRFTQADVRQIQLAKAAVAAGIATMLRERGAEYSDVRAVYLAGGFGSFLDPESASAIGLLPPSLLPVVRAVGNAAGAGAARLLLHRSELEGMEAAARSMTYLELSGLPYFSERFIEELFFPAPDAVPLREAPPR